MCHAPAEGEWKQLQDRLGVAFRDPTLLQTALTHSSYAHEHDSRPPDNEKLEYLGDAVLELIIRDYTWRAFPDWDEGQLSRLRAAVASKNSMARTARRLDLGSHLKVGKGEVASGGQWKPSLLADALEALVGAVYLDQGMEATHRIMLPHLKEAISRFLDRSDGQDWKSQLQELAQQRWQTVPEYELIRVDGPEHAKTFEVACHVAGRWHGRGTGKSKKVAEQAAAAQVLEQCRG